MYFLFFNKFAFKNKIMANTYTKLYVHAVFAVKYRRAVLEKSIRSKVFGVMGNLINDTGSKTLIVNGVEDHVHCLFSYKPKTSISDVLKVVKAKSSKYINDNHLTEDRFEWQRGFGAFTHGQREIDKMYNYIKNQEAHHNKEIFKDEYINLLRYFEIEFDEQYLFHELI
jgi:putative transposase